MCFNLGLNFDILEGLLKAVGPPAFYIYFCQASGEKGVNIWE